MIITRTPFRITLGGGGTDLPAYYEKYGGFIFAAGIDKYMFMNVNRPIVDDLVRVKYTKSEMVSHRDELEHDIAREALRLMELEKAVEIISMADIPAGTGLGSSGSYAVGLLRALYALKGKEPTQERLAEDACKIEIGMLNKPIGKQDQYMAAFGGLTVLEIAKDGLVSVRPARMSQNSQKILNRNLLMFYTQTSRSADMILAEQSRRIKKNQKVAQESMHYIKEIGFKILKAAESGNIDEIGVLFDQHWQYKKKISRKMSNPHFDHIYKVAKKNGALGGKISGAGGGGFFALYTDSHHASLRRSMAELGLREMSYTFDFEGTKVLANFGYSKNAQKNKTRA